MDISIQEEKYEYAGRARHISLDSLIGWSYALLGEDAQKVFRRLTAFPRKYLERGISPVISVVLSDLGDLETVFTTDFMKVLSSLRRHNFITMPYPYSFLRITHNTILDFGRRKLDLEKDTQGENEGERMMNHILENILEHEHIYFTTQVYKKEELKKLADAKGFSRRKFKGSRLFMFVLYDFATDKLASFLFHVPKWAKPLRSLLNRYIYDFLDLWKYTRCGSDIETAWRYMLDNQPIMLALAERESWDNIDGSTILELFDTVFRVECKKRLQRYADFDIDRIKARIEDRHRGRQRAKMSYERWYVWDQEVVSSYWCLHRGNIYDWEEMRDDREKQVLGDFYSDFRGYSEVQYLS